MNNFFDKGKGITLWNRNNERLQVYVENRKIIYELDRCYPFKDFKYKEEYYEKFNKMKGQYIDGFLKRWDCLTKPYKKVFSFYGGDISFTEKNGIPVLISRVKFHPKKFSMTKWQRKRYSNCE